MDDLTEIVVRGYNWYLTLAPIIATRWGPYASAIPRQNYLNATIISFNMSGCTIAQIVVNFTPISCSHSSDMIRANQPIHSFLVECLNPCLQEISAWVGSS